MVINNTKALSTPPPHLLTTTWKMLEINMFLATGMYITK